MTALERECKSEVRDRTGQGQEANERHAGEEEEEEGSKGRKS
jgi:hypothetical protein